MFEVHRVPWPHITGPGTMLNLPGHISDPELLAWIAFIKHVNDADKRIEELEDELDDARDWIAER